MERKGIMIRVSENLYSELLNLAKQEDRKLSNYITQILKKHIENLKKTKEEKNNIGDENEHN